MGTVAAATTAVITSDLALAAAILATEEDVATVTDTIVAMADAASTRTYGRPSNWRGAFFRRLSLFSPNHLLVAIDDPYRGGLVQDQTFTGMGLRCLKVARLKP
jgi:DNA-binding FadR family transcriptional regulator